jgi:hypothetical protein
VISIIFQMRFKIYVMRNTKKDNALGLVTALSPGLSVVAAPVKVSLLFK